MHPDAAKRMAKGMSYMESLVDTGKLPERVFPRFFYCGHKYLYGIRQEMRQLRCIACMHDWEVQESKLREVSLVCPSCGQSNAEADPSSGVGQIIFDITGDQRSGMWECQSCAHTWHGEDGTKCPACGAVKTT